MNVVWYDYLFDNPPKASQESIDKAEKELGVKLPADFLAIATTHQGGTPEPSSFDLPDGTGSSFGSLLHFEEDPFFFNIVVRREPVSDVLPDKVIPFAEDGGGNLLCFDYRETPDHPPVVFWDHEHCDDPPQPLASSFTDLLNKLYDDPD
jgi:cell wall assembly regulator SMI1